MFFKQYYLGCLAHASYMIASEGHAVVVDPQRDVDQYIQEAAANGWQIDFVIETHLHADFVSGHRELADRSGAQIVFGHRAGAMFPHMPVKDGDVLKVGNVQLQILETPGHTPESISILVSEAADSSNTRTPAKLLTGDTLFIGDVGRPDLAGTKGYTPGDMAAMMYDSLHGKILKLDDEVEVYPAHGAGSLCGRKIASETSSTIGEQRRTNYALKPMAKQEFIELLTADLPDAPSYFSRDAEINRAGAPSLTEMEATKPLSAGTLNKMIQQGVLILDVRTSQEFGAGHIPGSLHIGLSGQFAPWSGSLLEPSQQIAIVSNDHSQAEEATMRLARVGLHNVVGYLEGGLSSWTAAELPLASLPQITVHQASEQLSEESFEVIDVRRPQEYAVGHVPHARSIPLSELTDHIQELPTDRPIAVICASGYRSSIASSILERNGFKSVLNIVGGTKAWETSGFSLAS